MIYNLQNNNSPQETTEFIIQLKRKNFLGDIESGYDQRHTVATDNSIYQLLPQLVLYPKNTEDVIKVLKLINQPQFSSFTVTARGGGTGTNGQSLTNGIMLDTSRHMNKILDVNVSSRWAVVGCGVIKDQLNDVLKKDNLFFAPELSTSDRATIGGMVNTDASGQGSLVYGKTSDHVLEITYVMSDGSVHTAKTILAKDLPKLAKQQNKTAQIYNSLAKIYRENQQEIQQLYPNITRKLSGYDLKNLYNAQGDFNLNSVLCGSEGTLAIVCEIKINLEPIPEHMVLVVTYYDDFITALKDAPHLLTFKPISIETIDNKVLDLARSHGIWHTIRHMFTEVAGDINGMHFVEFTGETAKQLLNNPIEKVFKNFTDSPMLGSIVVSAPEDIHNILNMRKLSVGLLGRMQGNAKPIPFVEDTIVPPENLADFIVDFTEILNNYQLEYGMFGHTDAGVMHVRPAIDLKQAQHKKLIRTISDQVALLTKKYHGVLWGEHGKGFRSEYNQLYYGNLYTCLQQIKTIFDPENKLNPGKIATAESTNRIKLTRIDEVATRGESDKIITKELFTEFSQGLYCNGNGACFNYNPNQLMCPTFKSSKDRIHSPKGRSGLVREWLKQQCAAGLNIPKLIDQIRYQNKSMFWRKLFTYLGNLFSNNKTDFNHLVYRSLDGCVGCKSCAGQCPIKVNIPDIKARFFELYHSRYFRPLKHYLAKNLDKTLPFIAYFKPIYNMLVSNSIINKLTAKFFGLCDIPKISCSSPMQHLVNHGAEILDITKLQNQTTKKLSKMVILIQDPYTSFFDIEVVVSYVILLKKLGYQPVVAPYFSPGKAMHVLGFLHEFRQLVIANSNYLKQIAELNLPMIGVEPAVSLLYRDEYKEIVADIPKVQLFSEWLATKTDEIKQFNFNISGDFTLLSHCTEYSLQPDTARQWQNIFKAFGLNLTHKKSGCCGMAGLYGHESSHYQDSKKIFNLSWQLIINSNLATIVATGYSCRSQVQRFANKKLLHPITAIVNKLSNN